MPNTTLSYIQLLQFSYEHDNKIIEKVEKKEVEHTSVKDKASNNSILQCKSCGEKSDYSAQHGRYGYFIKFLHK